jgi:type IV pilus assembly protein PilW
MNMARHLCTSGIFHHNKGFSLVELMVALVITLILTAGIAQIFLSSKKSFTIQESLGRVQENGRYAIDTLVTDVRRAGYWGGNADITTIEDYTPGGVANGHSIATDDGTCTDVNWARMLTHRIFGKNDNRTGYTCLPSDTTHIGDVLVVRYAAPWVLGGVTTPTALTNHYYIRSSLFEGRLFRGMDVLNYTIPGAPNARTSELVSRAYFIHKSNNSNPSRCPGSGDVPSLYRLSLVNGTLQSEEIAYGVDNFQVQYGLDTNDDDSVDNYVDAQVATDPSWGQVIAARVWLSIRAECPETGYDNTNSYAMAGANYTPGTTDRDGDGNIDGDVDGDGTDDYRRQIFETTIRLRNQ